MQWVCGGGRKLIPTGETGECWLTLHCAASSAASGAASTSGHRQGIDEGSSLTYHPSLSGFRIRYIPQIRFTIFSTSSVFEASLRSLAAHGNFQTRNSASWLRGLYSPPSWAD